MRTIQEIQERLETLEKLWEGDMEISPLTKMKVHGGITTLRWVLSGVD